MKLIPVIDLKGGQVVAAKRGHRRHYAPLRSPLCSSSGLREVVDALLGRYPFDSLYIADLDAIEGGAGHLSRIASLSVQFPDLTLWLDAGVTHIDAISGVARPVIGTESLSSPDQLGQLLGGHPDALLSLDYRDERFVGPAGLDARPELWPGSVILMTLARVGSASGPDTERLAELRRIIPEHRIYAAGGVRGPEDLAALRDLGVEGVLVATALHQGRLTASDMAPFCEP
ncbi:HisA/HisF-related TIM barrel protein [Thiorhodococcus minor]|uniref:Nickel transporter n=1 Tax=Thiorhodococcus minor TaxID=57489 RepID=A0A6M0K4W7_9GAMM|nr:HisA/HisF-related TIM barrel protein [Thiorhodococcus minor]NEV63637.1 nickel transporter [Thiorhodococcus minor]